MSRRATRLPSLAAAPLGALAAALLGALAATQVAAVTIDFEGLPSASDVAAAALPGVDVSTALVLSESDVELLLGFAATGTWNTTPGGSQGLLNTLAPSVSFSFSVPVLSFSVNVLGLPGLAGTPQAVLLEAYEGATRTATVVSNISRFGDSGFHEDTLAVVGAGITQVVLTPVSAVACPQILCFDTGPTTSFFVDDVSFAPVPEPGTGLLVLAGLAGLALRRSRG
jgi:hypothetical protein